jgi:hypothetical protein
MKPYIINIDVQKNKFLVRGLSFLKKNLNLETKFFQKTWFLFREIIYLKNYRLIIFIFSLLLLSLILNGCLPRRMAYGDCDYRVKTGECRQQAI